MPSIFISYRRADSKASTGRIYDRLVAAFGKNAVFKDVDNIPPGQDFREVLHAATAKCQVMLIVIGPGWVSATDERGNRRLNDPNDFARIEVETGLERDHLTVIPLLVDGAPMPSADHMPEALQALAYKNAFVIHDDPLFHRDMDTLIHDLRGILRRERTFPWWIAVAAALLLIIAGAVILPPLLNQSVQTPTAEITPDRPSAEPSTQIAAVVSPSSATTQSPSTVPQSSVTPKPSHTAVPATTLAPQGSPTSIRCPGAPPSRLSKGMQARVVVGGTANRVRSTPSVNAPQAGFSSRAPVFRSPTGQFA